MPQLLFQKESDPARLVRTLFEKVRIGYLLGKDDPKHYADRWTSVIDELKDLHDDTSNFAALIKRTLDEKELFSDEAKNPESHEAGRIFAAIKKLRYSKITKDPFIEEFGEEVVDALLSDEHVYVKFLHWALRNDDDVLEPELYENQDLDPDEITGGFAGLDLKEKEIIPFIIEHYGDDKDLSRLESKYKGAINTLNRIIDNKEQMKNLVDLDLKKAEKSLSFIVPNKPMYRIFEIDDLQELRGFTGKWVVQEKYDGMRIQIHKSAGNVKIFSFNKKDITDKCPEQVKMMREKKFPDCILDAELMLFDGDTPLHRAEVVAKIFKNKKSDTILRAHVFDIMQHDDKDLTDSPLEERIKILFQNFSQHSDIELAFPSKKDTRIADSIKDVEEYSKEIFKIPTAEGVVLKDLTSTYFLANRKNPKWVKWKKFVDIDVIVLGMKKTKSDLFSYSVGVGPVEEGVEVNGVKYLNVGKALNTKIRVDVGDIVRVKVDEVRQTPDGFALQSAKVIEVPEVEHPDKVVTLEFLAKDTKKSLNYNIEALTKGYTITDHVHGEATIITKSDMDGFTIYGFQEDNLMAKNALANMEVWREQLGKALDEDRAVLETAIINEIKRINRPMDINAIVRFFNKDKELKRIYESVFNSNKNELFRSLKNKSQDHLIYEKQKFDLNMETGEPLRKEYSTPEEYRMGTFKVYLTKNENIQIVMKLSDETISWIIELDTEDDIFNLFGKSKKFRAEVARTLSKEKLIDSGEVELGVQRHGYHEYILNGNKFDTRLHFRVVPIDGKKSWVAFTSVKPERVDSNTDDGIWDIRQDKHNKLTL